MQRPRAKIHESGRAHGDARPEWEFLHELVFNVTGQNGFVSIEGLFNQMAQGSSRFQGLTWALGDMGSTVSLAALLIDDWPKH